MKKPTPQPTKQQIQQFIDALKNNESHFLDMGEYTIKLHNWMQIGLFINDTLSNSSIRVANMRKVLKDWYDGKKEVDVSDDGFGLLMKKY